MAKDRIYRRTPAGDRAVGSRRSVPDRFRAILVLVDGQVSSGAICGGMHGHSQKEVLGWVDQLETLGFIESIVLPPTPTPHTIQTEPDMSGGERVELGLPPAEAAIASTWSSGLGL